MLNRLRISGVSVAADTAGFANDVNTTAGLPFTLAATTIGDTLAHKAIITPSGSVTGNYALTGTGPGGEAQTETLATDTVNAVTSTKYWLILTQVLAPAGIGANTVDIGWTAASVSPWLYIEKIARDWGPNGMGFVAVPDSGSPTFGGQDTLDGGVNACDHSVVASKTSATTGTYTTPVQAIRMIWSAAGGASFHGLV